MQTYLCTPLEGSETSEKAGDLIYLKSMFYVK